MTIEITPEFSRPISIYDIETDEFKIIISASRSECDALAKRFSVELLAGLKANLKFFKTSYKELFRLEASYIAHVTQICVVTLEPITNQIEGEFFCTLKNTDQFIDDDKVIEFDLEDRDPPEALNNGSFDAGELVSEHLALEIDPFPRSNGAELLQLNTFFTDQKLPEDNPFEILNLLKTKNKN